MLKCLFHWSISSFPFTKRSIFFLLLKKRRNREGSEVRWRRKCFNTWTQRVRQTCSFFVFLLPFKLLLSLLFLGRARGMCVCTKFCQPPPPLVYTQWQTSWQTNRHSAVQKGRPVVSEQEKERSRNGKDNSRSCHLKYLNG